MLLDRDVYPLAAVVVPPIAFAPSSIGSLDSVATHGDPLICSPGCCWRLVASSAAGAEDLEKTSSLSRLPMACSHCDLGKDAGCTCFPCSAGVDRVCVLRLISEIGSRHCLMASESISLPAAGTVSASHSRQPELQSRK